MSITPPSRPRLTRPELEERIRAAFSVEPADLPPFYICGAPGYYLNSMGETGKNDRNMYDDALFLVSPNAFAGFNGNTDPSARRRGIATLEPGLWPVYQFDIHGGSVRHPAICQRLGPVSVRRDGVGLDTGNFGINIHRGGTGTTSSLGCQTVPPKQWDAFYELAKTEAQRVYGKAWNRARIMYILLPPL
jgi:lysozyme